MTTTSSAAEAPPDTGLQRQTTERKYFEASLAGRFLVLPADVASERRRVARARWPLIAAAPVAELLSC